VVPTATRGSYGRSLQKPESQQIPCHRYASAFTGFKTIPPCTRPGSREEQGGMQDAGKNTCAKSRFAEDET
jgi:hypothetical protein